MSAQPRSLAEADAPATPATSERPSAAPVLLALVILLMPFPLVLKKFTPGNAGYEFQAILFPSDLPLIALIIAMAPRLVTRIRQRALGIGGWLMLALLAWLTVTFVFNPSERGVADLVRLAGIVAIIVAILELRSSAERKLVLGALAVAAVFETVVATLQLITHAPVGLNAVGESTDPFWKIGSHPAPQGTLVHPYVLAALALVAGVIFAIVCIRTRSWQMAVLSAVAVAPVGFTFSRAALLGLAIAVVVLATGLFSRDRRRYLPAVAGLCVGAAVTAAVWHGGWVARTKESVTAKGSSQLTTDRGWLMHEAKMLIGEHPVVGVGPGRYDIALKERYGHERNKTVGVFKPVHNLPMLLAAEGGVLGGILMAALLVGVLWQAVRTGRPAIALWAVYLPYTQLDHLGYTFPSGLILTGLWLGMLDYFARTPADVP